MNKPLACGALLAIVALPGIASAECVGRVYHVSGKVADSKGRSLSTTITFSWAEEHDGCGVPVPGGGIYGCNATLKTLHYAYASAPGKQMVGDIALTGDQTKANLPVAGGGCCPALTRTQVMKDVAITNPKSVLAVVAVCIMLLCSPLYPVDAAFAQDTGGNTTLRQRIKERWLAKQQSRSSEQPAPADTPAKIDQPGDYTFSIVHGGLTRKYRVHVPRSYNAESPAPLLMAFHGGGGDMDHQANDQYYGQVSKSESAGFVAVFPNGFSKLPSGKFATWNAGACCGEARDRQVDDVGFVRQIISRVSGQLTIDPKRIYATGMSNGAMMAYRLACEMPDTFAAIAAVAGTDNTTQCTPKVPISTLHIHAQNDDRVLFNGGAGRKFADKAQVTDFASVPATVSRWVQRNACNPQPRRTFTAAGAYCERYAPCQGQAQVQLCVTETGGHSWPGGYKPRGDEPASQAITANDVMWTFFLSVQAKSVKKN